MNISYLIKDLAADPMTMVLMIDARSWELLKDVQEEQRYGHTAREFTLMIPGTENTKDEMYWRTMVTKDTEWTILGEYQRQSKTIPDLDGSTRISVKVNVNGSMYGSNHFITKLATEQHRGDVDIIAEAVEYTINAVTRDILKDRPWKT